MTEKERDAGTASGNEAVVTYIVVVHGIGEQRKNETAIAVVNRFAEARRDAREDDRRDVLTLGGVSRRTGTSMDPAKLGKKEKPWMEFEGIPCTAPDPPSQLGPFMGQVSSTGENLRFVDMCWSDVLRTAYKKAGQPVDVWAQGLLGRLLRKHEGAKGCSHAQVPFWIRRTLYLLADGLLLTRKAMRFWFKEMADLVFTKYLADVQIYGEYGRCRGRAVRRFHDMMAKIEERHWESEKSNGTCRKPKYVVIAHSLGSVMSFDALMYARAKAEVRKGDVPSWKFPGYDETGEAPCTKWIGSVASLVTLGSPIDKYLMIWWMNYGYLCTAEHLEETDGGGDHRIRHFNYCDELDPAGHHLEVVSGTAAYQTVFKACEDVVFNRYGVPGVAHNEYWADQALWRWILARSVDKQATCPHPPVWFEKKKYRQLLRWLYFWVPVAMVGVGYATLTLALEASSWQTAFLAATAFAVVLYLGRRLIDLAVWWRQIQRQEGEAARKRQSGEAATNCKSNDEDDNQRKKAARCFRWRAAAWPVTMALVGLAGVWMKTPELCQRIAANWAHMLEGRVPRDVVVAAVVVVVLLFIVRGRLPIAYRTPASGEGGLGAEWKTVFWVVVLPVLSAALPVGVGVALGVMCPAPKLQGLWAAVGDCVGDMTLLFVLASVIWAYRGGRFLVVRKTVGRKRRKVCYAEYAQHAGVG